MYAYVCTYICMYIHVRICMYMYTYVRMYVDTCVYTIRTYTYNYVAIALR